MDRALAAATALPLGDEAMGEFLGGPPRRLLGGPPVVDLLTDQLRLMASTYPDEVGLPEPG